MHGQRHSVCGVVRHFEKRIAGTVNSSIVARDKQMTFRVVPAAAAYRVHKRLIYLVGKLIGLLFLFRRTAPRIPNAVPAKLLVLTLKHQLVAVILKGCGDLRPHCLVTLHAFLFVFGKIIEPTVVPVDIDDRIHTCVKSPVNDFLYVVYIFGSYGISPVVGYHIRPRHGNTQYAEAAVGIGLNDFLSNYWTPPCSFKIARSFAAYPVAAGFKGVSEIYSVAHFLYKLGSGNAARFLILFRTVQFVGYFTYHFSVGIGCYPVQRP